MDTSYKSKIYYDIVLRNGSYKGWRTSFVGDGIMTFVKGKDYIEVSENHYGDKNWMRQCWEKFLEEVENNEFI